MTSRPVPYPRYPRLAAGLVAHCLFCTACVALTTGTMQFVLFHLSFGSFEFYSLYRVYLIRCRHREMDHDGGRLAVKLFHRGMASYGVGLFVWQFDLRQCHLLQVWWPAFSGLPNPQFHAWYVEPAHAR